MMLKVVFDSLRQQGLVQSEREFSRRWLGRAANYACESRLEDCSAATGVRLIERLLAAQQHEMASIVLASLLVAVRRE
jgi:hypothetical protein